MQIKEVGCLREVFDDIEGIRKVYLRRAEHYVAKVEEASCGDEISRSKVCATYWKSLADHKLYWIRALQGGLQQVHYGAVRDMENFAERYHARASAGQDVVLNQNKYGTLRRALQELKGR